MHGNFISSYFAIGLTLFLVDLSKNLFQVISIIFNYRLVDMSFEDRFTLSMNINHICLQFFDLLNLFNPKLYLIGIHYRTFIWCRIEGIRNSCQLFYFRVRVYGCPFIRVFKFNILRNDWYVVYLVRMRTYIFKIFLITLRLCRGKIWFGSQNYKSIKHL